MICDGCNSHRTQIITEAPTTTALPSTLSDLLLEPCTDEEWRVHECLNGGSCLVQKSLSDPNLKLLQCRCPYKYEGIFCQTLRPPAATANLSHASIAAGVVGSAVLLLLIVVVIIIIRLRKKHNTSSGHRPSPNSPSHKGRMVPITRVAGSQGSHGSRDSVIELGNGTNGIQGLPADEEHSFIQDYGTPNAAESNHLRHDSTGSSEPDVFH